MAGQTEWTDLLWAMSMIAVVFLSWWAAWAMNRAGEREQERRERAELERRRA